MRMAYSKDPRTNQVCKALIGKTILAGQWANGDGILIYVDMIRYEGGEIHHPCMQVID